tara:strand:- start:533 stop:643 length:111 start_codon:yes stop_codon:yes gene_type:complete
MNDFKKLDSFEEMDEKRYNMKDLNSINFFEDKNVKP